MDTPQISTKRLAISKSNAQMVAAVAAASFITVFCLIASKTVFSQNTYQGKVITAKEKARDQLKENLEAYDSLSTSYKIFDTKNPNIIGGNINGTGDNDGTNSKLILDALPPTYNFPALASSLEKILADRGLKVSAITGTDDQVAQQSNTSSPTPKPVEMPFTFTVNNATYTSISQLADALEHSIRPIQIDTINLSGGVNDMTATFTAHTYYQPAKSLQVTKKVIK
ncbi:MAG TPA: hypothetical protein VD706_02965 [Candidatus Saccharimonadales bacterium]|nr:hypothetical protein [Candidatus Saccharimonadales bacterium]